MIEPSLAMQTAIRSALLASPEVVALVAPDQIRAGGARLDRLPAIILSDPQTEFLGCAAGSQRLARVTLMAHVWAIEDGEDTARQIGAVVFGALEFGPHDTDAVAFDDWSPARLVWLRDPTPEQTLAHGVFAFEGIVRWRV